MPSSPVPGGDGGDGGEDGGGRGDGLAPAASVFAALADPTRRLLLERLSQDGPLTATDLSASLPISRQAVVKHLGSMSSAGLLRSNRRGREVLFAVEPGSLQPASDWLERVGRVWDQRLVALVKNLTPDED